MAMQMIYSAGSTSHSPRCSPVPPRKYPSPRPSPRASPREWRPVMPGYKPPAGHALVPYSRTPDVDHNPIIVTEDDTNLKDYIPAMQRPVAITCLVCNILFPGLGTFLSGTTVFCCARVRPKGASKMTVLKRNSWVALLQFVTAFIFLLGWIWSIMWGTSFLRISKESRYQDETEEGADSNHNSTSDESSAVSHRRSVASLNAANTSTTNTANNQAQQAPIIVLQEAPVAIHPNQSDEQSQQIVQTASGRPLNPSNPRHNRILRHQRDQQLPQLFLDPQNLENIVINHAPIPELMVTSSEPEPPWKG